MARKKKFKPGKARCIRSYERIAQQNHGQCPFCLSQIEAGEFYEGTIWVNGVDFWVIKQHVFCMPWDWDEDYEGRKHEDEEVEISEEKCEDLPMAA